MRTTWTTSLAKTVALLLWGLVPFQACGGESSPPAQPACGPGTALVNGQCVIAAQCGEGTVLKGDRCIPENTGGGASGQGGFAGGAAQAGSSGGAGAQNSGAGGQSGGQGGSSEGGAAGEPGAGSGGKLEAGSGGVPQGGSPGAGMAGAEPAGVGGSSGEAAVGGQAGSGGGEAGAGQGGQVSAGQAGAGEGGAGAAGEAGAAGSNPNDVDDPCPDEPIDFNCDPACGPVDAGCATIGCDLKIDTTFELFKTQMLIRTPSNPPTDPKCEILCGANNTKTVILVKEEDFPGKSSWQYRVTGVNGGWKQPGSLSELKDGIACVDSVLTYYEFSCRVISDIAKGPEIMSFYGVGPIMKARNIKIERFVDSNNPPTCP